MHYKKVKTSNLMNSILYCPIYMTELKKQTSHFSSSHSPTINTKGFCDLKGCGSSTHQNQAIHSTANTAQCLLERFSISRYLFQSPRLLSSPTQLPIRSPKRFHLWFREKDHTWASQNALLWVQLIGWQVSELSEAQIHWLIIENLAGT